MLAQPQVQPSLDFNITDYPNETVLTTSLAINYNSTWGPVRDSLYIVVPVTVIYVLIFISGVVGNVVTCIVISRNKHMHTATNYYLFSLAVSDLLLLVSGLPQEMYYIWSHYPYVFGELFCVVQGFAAETSANATVLTITAFTVERYVAICHPFLSHNLSKLSRALRLIVAIWLLALALAVPQAIQFGIMFEKLEDGTVLDNDHSVCTVLRNIMPYSFEISTCVFFVLPMTLITVLYILITIQLRKSSVVRLRRQAPGRTRAAVAIAAQQVAAGRRRSSRNSQTKATKHVVKMLVAVVVGFFICWAPFHAQRLLAVYGSTMDGKTPSPLLTNVYMSLTYVSGVLYYLGTSINPLLYHIMSHKFRGAFKETLTGYFGARRTNANGDAHQSSLKYYISTTGKEAAPMNLNMSKV